MFWTMSIILFVLWVLGMISGSTEGLWVHLLLAGAVVTLILAVSQRGRRVLA
ncbi:MAG TPA: lmo0937 family membrane protein [Myxococcaceae bacterium]|nr:lmo0937 family membrane protein [Myxococcaceae bacterium]